MRIENNFKKGAFNVETAKIKLRQYVSLLKSPNFEGATIMCFTTAMESKYDGYQHDIYI